MLMYLMVMNCLMSIVQATLLMSRNCLLHMVTVKKVVFNTGIITTGWQMHAKMPYPPSDIRGIIQFVIGCASVHQMSRSGEGNT